MNKIKKYLREEEVRGKKVKRRKMKEKRREKNEK